MALRLCVPKCKGQGDLLTYVTLVGEARNTTYTSNTLRVVYDYIILLFYTTYDK